MKRKTEKSIPECASYLAPIEKIFTLFFLDLHPAFTVFYSAFIGSLAAKQRASTLNY